MAIFIAITEDELLPSYFRNYVFYVDLLPDDVKQEIQRYIIAYDGDVSSQLNQSVTHIVCRNQLQLEVLQVFV